MEVELSIVKSVNPEEEEKKVLDEFIATGFALFSSKFEEYKIDNVPSSSFGSKAVSNTAGGIAAGLAIFTLGGAGAAVARSQVQSMVEKPFIYFSSEKYKKERNNILTWTNSIGDNEKEFLFAVVEGLAYICIAFKDQIQMFPKNVANNKNFFDDVYRRIFKHMKENPRDKASIMSPEELYNAFINGLSTPQGAFEQMQSLKKKRGLHLLGFNRQKLNTADLFENCGHIVSEEGNEKFTLFVHKVKNANEEINERFRYKYNFEEGNPKSAPSVALNDNNPIYDEIRKCDWRLKPNNIQNYIKNICQRIFVKKSLKWFPAELFLPKAFLRRKNDNNISLVEEMNRILIAVENSRNFLQHVMTLSGLGGVGKSTTAKWFAREFQDNYAHIICIDCGGGGGRILSSFRSLARFLKIEATKEMEINDLARNCFIKLKDFNCLWIYDSAECYIDETNGIHNALPQNYKNFHVIITSRNTEWGNETGLGKIQKISLKTFDQKEAMEFVKNSFNDLSTVQERKFKKLCLLVGNLPLALQIAIATLKETTISLEKYTKKIKTSDQIIHENVDSYDGTLKTAMEISLKAIQRHHETYGELAYQILIDFGYITSSDVDILLFSAIENESMDHIDMATELLEKYSLIGTTIINTNKYISIHPMLQKVIRLIQKNNQTSIISKILKCEGFLEYKLIPFNFADTELKKQFPQIESELIEKLKLEKLLREQRFQEAVDLASIINDKWKHLCSTYNYAHCLKQNNDTQDAMLLFENLYEKVGNITNIQIHSEHDQFHLGLLSLTDVLHGQLVGGQLMQIYLEDENIEKTIEILKKSGGVFECHSNCLDDTIKSFSLIQNCSIEYNGSGQYLTATARENDLGGKIELSHCTVNEATFSSHLTDSDLLDLTLNEVQMPPGCLLSTILSKCDGKVQKLNCKNMDAELNGKFALKEVQLENIITDLNWKGVEWDVNKFTLIHVDFVETNYVKCKELVIYDSEIDINVLPIYLEKLILVNSTCVNCCLTNNSIDMTLPSSLVELNLKNVKFKDTFSNKLNQVDIGASMFMGLSNLNSFTLDCLPLSSDSSLTVSWDCLHFIESVNLFGCNVVLNTTDIEEQPIRISPKRLTLMNVTFLGESDKKENKYVLVNKFVDFCQMKELKLSHVSVDLSDENISMDCVHLVEPISVLDWKNSKCVITKLVLFSMDFIEKTQLKVKEIEISGSGIKFVDISLLPCFQDLTKIELHKVIIINLSKCSFQTLRALHSLTIHDVQFSKCSSKIVDISHLIFPTLKHLKLFFKNANVNVCLAWESLASIESLDLNYCTLIYKTKTRITPKVLKLENVSLRWAKINCSCCSKKQTSFFLNDFVDATQIENLHLGKTSFADS